MIEPTLPPDSGKPLIEDYELKELDIRYNSSGQSSAWVVMLDNNTGEEEILRMDMEFDLIIVLWSALLETLDARNSSLDSDKVI